MALHNVSPQPEQIKEWNDTRHAFSSACSVIELIDLAAIKYADSPAVRTTTGVALTHERLAAESTMLSYRIAAAGVLPRSPVGLLADHVPEAVTAVHAIIRAGAFYVPMDPRWPMRRMVEVLKSIELKYLIATERYAKIAAKLGADLNLTVIMVPLAPSALPGLAPLQPAARPDDLAYTIFTSGSTGLPKAVAVRHASVVNLIEWFNRRNNIENSDILLQVAAFSFDLSVYDLFGILAAGASILTLPDADLEGLEEVATALVEQQITLWNSAPAAFTAVTNLLDESSRSRRDALRRVFLSGDWIPLSTPGLIRREFPHASLVALGGATEACVWSNDFVVDAVRPSWRSIPYGHPMQNSRYYVLREDSSPCEVGEAGELYISGVCVAAGYLNDPVLTAERFLPDPWEQGEGCSMYRTGDRARWTSDGWVEFLGRLDSQVKVRGFRIELGEIEYAAQRIPGVAEAVAITFGDPQSPDIALALKTTKDLDPRAVYERLGDWLPIYMRPGHIISLSSFPVGETGKVDRRALRKLLIQNSSPA